MSMTFQEWLADVNGRVIGNGQCVGLVEDYAQRVCGTGQISTDGTEHPGYAMEMWHNGPSAGYSQVPATSVAMPGYIAIYGWGFQYTPLSHCAVVINGGMAVDENMSQNPGPAHRMSEPKIGLLGYLVPGASNAPNAVGAVNIQTAGNVISDVSGFMSVWPKISAWVTDSNNWKRIGLATVGVIAIIIVLVKLFNMESTVKEVAKNVTAN